MRLFSRPGTGINERRAALLTPPFDRALAVPSTVTPTRTGALEWDADDAAGALGWDAADVAGTAGWGGGPAPVLTWE